MLIECWPLLSTTPRPYQRPSALGQRPGRKALAPCLVEAADHVAVAIAEHGRQRRRPRCARRSRNGAGAFGCVRIAAREAQRLEGRPHLVVEIARRPARAPGSGSRSAWRRGAPGRLEAAGVEVCLGAAAMAASRVMGIAVWSRHRPLGSGVTRVAGGSALPHRPSDDGSGGAHRFRRDGRHAIARAARMEGAARRRMERIGEDEAQARLRECPGRGPASAPTPASAWV